MLLLDAANFTTKVLLYAASLGGIAAALHGALGFHTRRRAYLWIAALVAAAAALRLVVLNAQMGGSLASAFSLEQFGWTWAGGGRPALALLAGAALLAMSAGLKNRAVPLLAAGSISAAFALTGHTAGLASPGFAPWIVLGHLLIAGFWLGAPATLWPRTTTTDAEVLGRTEAFSRIARLIVPLLFASGLYLFWRINGGFETALATGYGRLLAAKLLLATVILGLGALNMTLVTRQLISDPAKGRAALRSTLRIDAILFAVILVLIAAATTLSGPTE